MASPAAPASVAPASPAGSGLPGKTVGQNMRFGKIIGLAALGENPGFLLGDEKATLLWSILIYFESFWNVR